MTKVVTHVPNEMAEQLWEEARDSGLSLSSFVRMKLIEATRRRDEAREAPTHAG